MSLDVISRDEARTSGMQHYFTGRPCKNGGLAKRITASGKCMCTACVDKARASARATYAKNPEVFKARSMKHHWANRDELVAAMRERRAQNADQIRRRNREQYANNPRTRLEANSAWVRKNKATVYAKRAEWRRKNFERHLAANAAYRAARRNATPHWLTPSHREAMVSTYREAKRREAETGIPHHVDHIVPLTHPLICGLHVPWNLRAIPANDNLVKSNRFDIEAA